MPMRHGVIGLRPGITCSTSNHRAIAAHKKALELDPNDADVLNDFGHCLSFAGRVKRQRFELDAAA